jgi:GDPmannose 4,6-dehydratase
MADKKKALLTGISGQDGSYLAELLLDKGYEVHGVIRRASDINTRRIDHLFDAESRTNIHYGDLATGLDNLIYQIKPDEIYNLGAMSHVRVSFDVPVYTGDVTGLAVTRILESVRRGIAQGILKKGTKYYQASSSEMFGQTPTPPNGYNEDSVFTPVSPYGCAKLYGYHITKTYRTGYNIYAATGNSVQPRIQPAWPDVRDP